MKLRKYEGRTLQEALRRVREDLGEDAVVLQTFAPQAKGIWRLLGRDKFVILAGKGFRVVPNAAKPGGEPPGAELLRRVYGRNGAPGAGAPADPAARRLPEPAAPAATASELAEIRSALSDLASQIRNRDMADAPEEIFQSYVSLVNANISKTLAKSIVGRLRETLPPDSVDDPQVVQTALRAAVQDMIPVAPPMALSPGRARRVMLVGPTGVGKTTTIAKLAGNYSVKEDRSVALITIDTFRIAATDQLRRIAELLDIPIAVARTPEELSKHLDAFSGRDLVLVDSAGRSQRDTGKMDELAPFIGAARPDELHLVLAASTHPDTLLDQAGRFGRFPVSHVILTKVDEAARFGLILDVLSQVKSGVSWLTTGQAIPQDIEAARPERIADLILREAKRA
jgi:flagellar biosynthesis protein FlhF